MAGDTSVKVRGEPHIWGKKSEGEKAFGWEGSGGLECIRRREGRKDKRT